MKLVNTWAFGLLLLCGCGRVQGVITESDQNIVFRIVASSVIDSKLVELSQSQTGEFVRDGDVLIGQWFLIKETENVFRRISGIENAVTRKSGDGVELLVVHQNGDLVKADIEQWAGTTTCSAGEPAVQLRLTKTAGRRTFAWTVENVDRHVAVITDGQVRALPKIKNPIHTSVVLSDVSLEKVSLKGN